LLDSFDSSFSQSKSHKDQVEVKINLSAQAIKRVNLEELTDTMRNTTKTKGEKRKFKTRIQIVALP
jgi:hypothetical protein